MKARRLRQTVVVFAPEVRCNEPVIPWYRCGTCNTSYLREWFRFCPECGLAIRWVAPTAAQRARPVPKRKGPMVTDTAGRPWPGYGGGK